MAESAGKSEPGLYFDSHAAKRLRLLTNFPEPELKRMLLQTAGGFNAGLSMRR